MDDRGALSWRAASLLLVGAAALGGPAIAMIEFQVGPGRWIVTVQDQLFGYHFPVFSMAILMLLEIAFIAALVLPIALVVRKVTGRTVVDLFRRRD